MEKCLCLSFLTLFACLLPLNAQQSSYKAPAVEQEILAQEKEIWDLSVREDWDAWSKLVAEDALPVYSDGYASKTEVLQALRKSSDPQHSSNLHYSMDDVRVIPVRDGAGLIVYKVTTDWKEGDKTIARQYYVSSLWLKLEGKWQCRFWQETDTTLPANNSTTVPADEKQQVRDLSKEWVAAEVKHDANTLRRILDDKFVASFGAEKPYDKEAFIKLIVKGDVDPTESQTLTDETVVIHQDTAVEVGTDTVRGTQKGAAYNMAYRYTVTYIRRNGQWVVLAEHLVQLPQAK